MENIENTNNLVILSNKKEDTDYNLKVIFKDKPVAEQEIIIGIKEGWSKKVYTDENGNAEFTAPWKSQYVMEAIYNEETPGTFKGMDYEVIRHCATHSIDAAE